MRMNQGATRVAKVTIVTENANIVITRVVHAEKWDIFKMYAAT